MAVSWRRGEQREVHRDIRPGGVRWTLACLGIPDWRPATGKARDQQQQQQQHIAHMRCVVLASWR